MGEIWTLSPSWIVKFSNALVTDSWLLLSGTSSASMVRLSCDCTRSTSMWRSVPDGRTPPANSNTSARFFSPLSS